MRKVLFLLLASPLFLSCSVSKKLELSAREDVLNANVLKTAHVGISVYEPATGKTWYDYQGATYFVPASNTKIPTCYAAMKYLGDSLVGLRYLIVNDSLVKIKACGDPTFLHHDFKVQKVYEWLQRFRFISISGELFNENFLGSGWSWNDFKESYMAQRSDFPIYGNVVKINKKSEAEVEISPSSFRNAVLVMEPLTKGFEVVKPWEENKFLLMKGSEQRKEIPFRPDPATIGVLLGDTIKSFVNRNFDKEGYAPSTELHFQTGGKLVSIPLAKNTAKSQWLAIYSQPTDSLLRPMMHRSDNFFAEQALLMVSNERLGFMNDEKIIDTLLKTDFKDLPQKPRWVDGSGLSRYNLFTPQDFVFILNKMKDEFGMTRLKNILATGGEGTLSNYYVAERDFLYAKTGTLSGVVALSGFLTTKKGRELIFSVQVNNHNGSATEVRRAVEKFIQGLRERY